MSYTVPYVAIHGLVDVFSQIIASALTFTLLKEKKKVAMVAIPLYK